MCVGGGGDPVQCSAVKTRGRESVGQDNCGVGVGGLLDVPPPDTGYRQRAGP